MKILIIEDEDSIRYLIKMNLILENFEVLTAKNGKEGVELFNNDYPDLVILDLMLPDDDGFNLLKNFQKLNNDIPIIILTAKNTQNDKLLGLELGADDYITKPFDSKELILRIKNILKRIKKSELKDDLIKIGPFKIEKSSRIFFIDNKEIYLTKKEFNLMSVFLEKYGKVLSRDYLLQKLWDFDVNVDTRAVDMVVQRLRKKLGNYGKYITSLYGVGYKFEVNNEK
ncbi:response regulator transcription factor [Marinitoga arctica]